MKKKAILILFGLLVVLCISFYSYFARNDKNKDFDYIGHFINTDKGCFFVAEGDSQMFSSNEFIIIRPVDNAIVSDIDPVTFEGLCSGDKIGVNIVTVGDTYPRIMDIYKIGIIEKGSVSNIDESVKAALRELGFEIM